jgi:hypothetical protein
VEGVSKEWEGSKGLPYLGGREGQAKIMKEVEVEGRGGGEAET